MSVYFRSLVGAIAVSASIGVSANAQELATEILEEIFEEMEQQGTIVNVASKTTSGKTAEWTTVTLAMPSDKNVTAVILPKVTATEMGGGKVSVVYPDTLSMLVDPKGEAPVFNMNVTNTGAEHIVSGPKNARQHDFSGPNLKVELESSDGTFNMTANVNDFVSSAVKSGGEVRNSKGIFKAAKVDFDYTLVSQGQNMSSTGGYKNLKVEFDADAFDQTKLDQLLDGTRGFSAAYSVDSATGKSEVQADGNHVVVDVTTGAGVGSFALRKGVFSMIGSGDNAAYSMTFKSMPLPPFALEIDKATAAFEMPLKKTNEPLPAKMQFRFSGLKASDTVWGMVDPAAVLPRDPATLNIDLTAQMRWLVDVMDAQKTQSVPIEVETVTVNNITLEVAGATLMGQGGAKINNTTFPPMPIGAFNLDLKGGIGLVDKLISIGLVPQQQGMMVKGMAGVFGKPGGSGPDHLTSEIEMQGNGAILVNGQRVK